MNESINAVLVSQKRSGSTAYNAFLAKKRDAIPGYERMLHHNIKEMTGSEPCYTCNADVFAVYLEDTWEFIGATTGKSIIHKVQATHWDPMLYPVFTEFFNRHKFRVYTINRYIGDRFISQIMRRYNDAKYVYAAGMVVPDEWIVPSLDEPGLKNIAEHLVQEELDFNAFVRLMEDGDCDLFSMEYEAMVSQCADQLTDFQVIHDHFPKFDVQPYYDYVEGVLIKYKDLFDHNQTMSDPQVYTNITDALQNSL